MNVCTFSETCFLDALDKINVTHVSLLNIGLSSQRDDLKTGTRGKVRVGVNPRIAHLVVIGQPVSQDFFVNHVYLVLYSVTPSTHSHGNVTVKNSSAGNTLLTERKDSLDRKVFPL